MATKRHKSHKAIIVADYENGMAHRLRHQGVNVEQQYSLPVYDADETILGQYYADLLINEELIIELKACQPLLPEHTAQLLGYLRASHIRHGLLVNFGAVVLQLKKYVL